jgi:CheY-like chemotaxis protein
MTTMATTEPILPEGILVIEDDPEIRKFLLTLLGKHGYSAIGVPHGAAALEVLARDPLPGLILLDLYLPVMDGWEFRARQLQDGRLAAVPVVVITAASDAHVDSIAAEQVIKKPLDVPSLLSSVRRHCGPPARRPSEPPP